MSVGGLTLALALALGAQDAPHGWSATVGMPVRIRDLVLPGGELEPVPAPPDAALVIRLDAARPHGDGFRYDLEAYALEPGEHDLGAALRRKDGTAAELPPLPFEVKSLLPPGRVEPHALAPGRVPLLGGYRAALAILGALWLAGLVWMVRRRRRARVRPDTVAPAARTRADRVAELVEAALHGELDGEGRAALERALIALHVERLGLGELDPADAVARLERDAEAGPLLAALERWLHRPDAEDVDLGALLAPYRVHAPARAPGLATAAEGR